MAFPPEFLDEIRARVALSDVIGRRVKLTRKGREHTGLCPFHNEKTPSFTVSDEKGFYHCFGCGAHGSAFDFVMETEGLSFPEAVERLATDVGLQVPKSSPEDRARAERSKSLAEVCEVAARFFERSLRAPDGKEALAYLRRRGVAEATMETFRLGFAPESNGALRAHLARDGVTDAMMIEAGLTVQPEDRDRAPYDRFRGRVMFPIADRRGRVVAFGGRALSDKGPKYLNSPETPLFHKGHMLYGLHQAQGPARTAGTVIVTEGYMDVIALSEGGFAHAIAPLGTALTEDQLAALWRIVDEPVLCFDGDAAGARAAGRAAERALGVIKAGKGLRFAELPSGADPDDLIRARGRAAFDDVLSRAMPLSEVIWRMETGGRLPREAERRAAVQRRLDDHVRRIQDPTVRSHMGRAFKDRMWQAGRSGGGWGAGGGKRGRLSPGLDPALVKGGAVDSDEEAKRVLLACALVQPRVLDLIEDTMGALDMADARLDALRGAVLDIAADDPDVDADGLADRLDARGFAAERTGLTGDDRIRALPALRPGAQLADVAQLAAANRALLGRTRAQADVDAERGHIDDADSVEAQEAAWARLQALKRAEFAAREDE